MSNIDGLKEQLGQALLSAKRLLDDPKKCLDECIQIFKKWTDDHPLDDPIQYGEVAEEYVAVSKRFRETAYANEAALILLLDGQNRFVAWQQQTGKRVSRAAIFNELSAINLHIFNDLGAAIWWSLHTQADLAFDDRPNDVGRIMLEMRLGVPKKAVDRLSEIAAKNRIGISDWSGKEAFAEETVREFAVTCPEFSFVFGQSSMRIEFPICDVYYKVLLGEFLNAKSIGHNHDAKKKSLERLASYLFLLIPGCVPKSNQKDENQTYETDLVVRNLNPNSNLIADTFGRNFIVECKNTTATIGVRDVGYFLHRIYLMHASFGIMFAKNDISGKLNQGATKTGKANNEEEKNGEADKERDERAARQLIRRTYHENDVLCIVLTSDHLKQLGKGDKTFLSLLWELSEKFRFGS